MPSILGMKYVLTSDIGAIPKQGQIAAPRAQAAGKPRLWAPAQASRASTLQSPGHPTYESTSPKVAFAHT